MIIWIASYPKSGNTWLRSFLSTYFYTNDNNFKFEYLKNIKQFNSKDYNNQSISNIEEAIKNSEIAQEKIISKNKTIILKTHSALLPINGYNFTSKKYTAGAIYIVRDPRNVVTSLGNHYNFNFDQSLNFMCNSKKYIIDDRKNGKNFSSFQFISSWSNNYKSWKNCKEFKVLFIRYEDLEINQYSVFIEIIDFINSISKKKEEISELKVKKIIESINFDLLKQKEKKIGFPEAVVGKNNKKINFFFLGKKNKWKEIYDSKKINMLNTSFKDELSELNYK